MAFKLVPYGFTTFDRIRNDNVAFVDKTRFIEELERLNSPFPLFLRPRRFGKTVLTSMLFYYYDKALAGEFDKLFKGTYIYDHKTELQGKFYVLKFEFSGIDADNLVDGFIKKLRWGMRDFFKRYPHSGRDRFLENSYESPSGLWQDFCESVGSFVDQNLYVLIDEYDYFANEVLANNKGLFEKITSSTGFLKNFYANLKDQASGGVISRIFITGVTSISLDSVTSGFNIQKNISQLPMFADAIGFTEVELRKLICETVDVERCGVTVDALVERMKDYYNGYRFSPNSDASVYNASMCLYFLDSYQSIYREPYSLFDPAVGMDIGKVCKILSAFDGKMLRDVVEATLEGRLIEFSQESLVQSMNFNNPQLNGENALAILYFMGYLTHAKGQEDKLCCPNKAMRSRFFAYFFITLTGGSLQYNSNALKDAFDQLSKGSVESLLVLVARTIREKSGMHIHAHLSEAVFQMAFFVNPRSI